MVEMSILRFPLLAPVVPDDENWRGVKDRRISTGSYTNKECDHKPANTFSPKNQKTKEYQNYCKRGVQRPVESLQNRIVDHFGKIQSSPFAQILPDPVKNHNRVMN